MGADEGGGRSLEETPTWAVSLVCFVLVAISILIEHIIHLIGKVIINCLAILFPIIIIIYSEIYFFTNGFCYFFEINQSQIYIHKFFFLDFHVVVNKEEQECSI